MNFDKLNLNFNLSKFGTGGGINRHKYIIFFVIFFFSINIKSFGLSEENGVYQIENKNDLIEFAEIVNGEHDSIDQNISANAILKNNIEFNKDSTDQSNLIKWHDYGKDYAEWLENGKSGTEPSTSGLEKPSDIWTPIGKDSTKFYTGIFDGNGFSISGLFCNVEKTDGSRAYAGLFGCIDGGEVKNLGIKDSFIRASSSGGSTCKGYVGGLIGYCSGGEVTNSYSIGCTVVGYGSGYGKSKGSGYGGGLIGYCSGGEVTNSYSSGCIVVGYGSGYGKGSGYGYGGGLIGYCDGGTVTSCYSTNTNLTATGTTKASKGGICGFLGSETISNCYYLKDKGVNDGGGTDSDTTGKTSPATDTEFKNGTVRNKLNQGAGKTVFKQNPKEDGHRYLLLDWEPEIELKIPVRVKINYDPSNKLENLVSKNFKHEFFRKIEGKSWKKMFEEKQYSYTVSPVENSIKINPDGSKTQDFIFNYYIYHAQDNSGNEYKFGFNKKYPVNTYIKQDVGGGKKLYIDYGVWGRE